MPSSPRRRTVTVVSVVVALVATAAWLAVTPRPVGAHLRSLAGLTRGIAGDTPGAHHAFLQTQPGSRRPVGWDPCRPVRFVVDPAGAPRGWEMLLDDALAQAGAASGLDLEVVDTTDERTFSGRAALGPDPDPVLVGWADAREVPGLAGDVVGFGGAVSVDQGGVRRYTTGSLVLDRDVVEQVAGRRDGDALIGAVLLHELAHVLGLGHVADRGEIMHRDGVSRLDLGPGDRDGLARLGAQPCA